MRSSPSQRSTWLSRQCTKAQLAWSYWFKWLIIQAGGTGKKVLFPSDIPWRIASSSVEEELRSLWDGISDLEMKLDQFEVGSTKADWHLSWFWVYLERDLIDALTWNDSSTGSWFWRAPHLSCLYSLIGFFFFINDDDTFSKLTQPGLTSLL